MNLKKGKFKIVEGTRVRMVSSKDTHIVEGAYGTEFLPAAVAFFRDDDDAHADG